MFFLNETVVDQMYSSEPQSSIIKTQNVNIHSTSSANYRASFSVKNKSRGPQLTDTSVS